MDEVLRIMSNTDINVLSAIVQAICSNELAMRGILQQNGADCKTSGLQDFLDMIFKEIERRERNDK